MGIETAIAIGGLAAAGVGAAGAAGAFKKKGGGIELPPPPPIAPPVADSVLSATARDAAELNRRRRGRNSLVIDPGQASGGTGLNIPV